MTSEQESRLNAYKAAVRLLSCSDNTRAMLIKKLQTKGFTEEDAECAADTAEAEGYLKEIPYAERTVQTLYDKGCGPILIMAKLKEKLFSAQAVKAARRVMSGLDFTLSAKHYYASEIKKGTPREKILASLYRKGFQIK